MKNAGSFVIVKLYTNMVNPRAAEFPPERKLEKYLTMAPEELRQLAMRYECSPDGLPPEKYSKQGKNKPPQLREKARKHNEKKNFKHPA